MHLLAEVDAERRARRGALVEWYNGRARGEDGTRSDLWGVSEGGGKDGGGRTHEAVFGRTVATRSALAGHLPGKSVLLHEGLEVVADVDGFDDGFEAGTCGAVRSA